MRTDPQPAAILTIEAERDNGVAFPERFEEVLGRDRCMPKGQDAGAIIDLLRAQEFKPGRPDVPFQRLRQGKDSLGNLRRPNLQEKLDRGPQPGDYAVSVGTRLEFLAARGVVDLPLRNEIA